MLLIGKGNGNPLQVFLPGKSHGQRSLAGYSPWGHKESDMIEQLNNSNNMVLIVALLWELKKVKTKLEAFWDWASESCCSVAKSHLPLCDPMDYSMPGFPVLHYLPEFAQSIESVVLSNHLILCPRLLLVPSIFPNIRVFSNQLILHVRQPKY